jgi:hypothetical protein
VVVKAPVITPKPNPTPPYYPPNISVQSKPTPLPTHIQQLKDPVVQKASGSSNYVYQTGSSNPSTTNNSSSYTVTSSAANKAQAQLGGAKILTPAQAIKQLNDNPSTQKPIFGPVYPVTSPKNNETLNDKINQTQNDTAKVADKLNFTPGSSGQLINGKYNEIFTGQTTSSTTFKLNQTVFVDKNKNAKETEKNTNTFIKKGLSDITFEGFASPEGSASNNLTLSTNRAITQMNAYRDDLKKQGWTCSGDCGTKDGKVTMINPQGKSVNLTAVGRGEVQPNTGGALGAAFANAALKGCVSNSQSGCNAAFAPLRTTIVTAGKPGTLTGTKLDEPTTTCAQRGDCPPKEPTTTCAERGDCPTDKPTTCTQRGDCPTTVTTATVTVIPRTTTPTINPRATTTTVNPGSTTTSILPSSSGVTGGSTVTPTSPSGAGSTTSSGSSSSVSTGTPTSGVGSSSGSSSSGSSLLPPTSGFGSTPSTGGSTSTPAAGGTSSNPTPAPRFKVS